MRACVHIKDIKLEVYVVSIQANKSLRLARRLGLGAESFILFLLLQPLT